MNSSVLTNRVGYKEIFLHYIKCRSLPKVFNDYLAEMFYTMEIKNISLLYEYWVYFRIANELYGTEAILDIVECKYELTNLAYGLKISNNTFSLYYNKTYKHTDSESYNFNFRPDISLEVIKNGKIKRFYFDAKYSNKSLPTDNDDPNTVYKNQNVVKMLSYLEAIKDSEFAVIVYPGTIFSFYSKNINTIDNFINDPSRVTDFAGVGAVPLSPNHVASNELFHSFMNHFKNNFLATH
jgi:predicted component of viral defense system (DUF524 family)